MSHVYFIQSHDPVGHIKIGHSCRPSSRLLAVGIWSPFELSLLATIPATEAHERRFHARFQAHHTRGEWFRDCAEIRECIESIEAGRFDLEGLPDPVDLRYVGREKRGDGLGGVAISITHRLNHLRNRGVTIPTDVEAAATRFSNNPYQVGWHRDRNPADARIAIDWLADHSPVPPRIAAAVAKPTPDTQDRAA